MLKINSSPHKLYTPKQAKKLLPPAYNQRVASPHCEVRSNREKISFTTPPPPFKPPQAIKTIFEIRTHLIQSMLCAAAPPRAIKHSSEIKPPQTQPTLRGTKQCVLAPCEVRSRRLRVKTLLTALRRCVFARNKKLSRMKLTSPHCYPSASATNPPASQTLSSPKYSLPTCSAACPHKNRNCSL